MASEIRHAAWQDEKSFTVRLLTEEGDPTELVSGLGEFLEAVDFAVEWLAREDPDRTGTASLAIFETRSGTDEKVWAYPPDQREGDALMKIFGFDPVNWKSAGAGFAPREPARGTFFTRTIYAAPLPKSSPDPVSSKSAPAPPPVVPIASQPAVHATPPALRVASQLTVVPAEEDVTDISDDRPAPSRTGFEPRRALAAAWDDKLLRSCLLLACFSLWLALALSEATVLVLFFVALSGIWWRRDKLVGTAETDADDWL